MPCQENGDGIFASLENHEDIFVFLVVRKKRKDQEISLRLD